MIWTVIFTLSFLIYIYIYIYPSYKYISLVSCNSCLQRNEISCKKWFVLSYFKEVRNAYSSLASVSNLPRWFWMIQLLPRCYKIRQSTSGWSYLLSVLSLLWCYLCRQRSITFLLFSGSNIDWIKSARCVIVASETTIQMSHIANETDGKLLLHKCSFFYRNSFRRYDG